MSEQYLFLVSGCELSLGIGYYIWATDESSAYKEAMKEVGFEIGSVEKIEHEMFIECEGEKNNYEVVICNDEVLDDISYSLFNEGQSKSVLFSEAW